MRLHVHVPKTPFLCPGLLCNASSESQLLRREAGHCRGISGGGEAVRWSCEIIEIL